MYTFSVKDDTEESFLINAVQSGMVNKLGPLIRDEAKPILFLLLQTAVAARTVLTWITLPPMFM